MKTKNSKVLGFYKRGKSIAEIRTCINAKTNEVLYYYCIPESRVYISAEEFETEWSYL